MKAGVFDIIYRVEVECHMPSKKKKVPVKFKNLVAGLKALKGNDVQGARKRFIPDAEAGNPEAQFLLGLSYIGDSENYDPKQAMEWFLKAAKKNHHDACYWIGILYELGKGVKKDSKQTIKWWSKAANQGNAELQRMIAAIYSQGRGIPKDHAKAVIWYRKASNLGDINAQWWLSDCYRKGLGVKRSYTKAYFWTAMSCAQDDDKGEDELKRLEKKMTARQISTAKRLVANWRPMKRKSRR